MRDRPVPRDGKTPGHLQCRGHWIAGGYFRQPEVDLRTEDGWMRTGDIAVIDPDNTLHIVDRAKDVIKSGGEWISSQALEEAATRHPAVHEAAVVAMPHPRWQERPFLIVVTEGGARVSRRGVARAPAQLRAEMVAAGRDRVCAGIAARPDGKVAEGRSPASGRRWDYCASSFVIGSDLCRLLAAFGSRGFP